MRKTRLVMTSPAVGSGPGERIALQFGVSSPSFGMIGFHEVRLGGNFSGGTNFSLYRAEPGSDNVETFVPTTLVDNGGTFTLRLTTPYVGPAATNTQFQVRFTLTGGQAVLVTISRVGGQSLNSVFDIETIIHWN